MSATAKDDLFVPTGEQFLLAYEHDEAIRQRNEKQDLRSHPGLAPLRDQVRWATESVREHKAAVRRAEEELASAEKHLAGLQRRLAKEPKRASTRGTGAWMVEILSVSGVVLARAIDQTRLKALLSAFNMVSGGYRLLSGIDQVRSWTVLVTRVPRLKKRSK